jgi:hypothetical protein
MAIAMMCASAADPMSVVGASEPTAERRSEPVADTTAGTMRAEADGTE